MLSYTRKVYTGRGAKIPRDRLKEAILAPKCRICDEYLHRTIYTTGRIEGIAKFLKRKICSKKECKAELQRRLNRKFWDIRGVKPKEYCSVCKKLMQTRSDCNLSKTHMCRKCLFKTGWWKTRIKEANKNWSASLHNRNPLTGKFTS